VAADDPWQRVPGSVEFERTRLAVPTIAIVVLRPLCGMDWYATETSLALSAVHAARIAEGPTLLVLNELRATPTAFECRT